MNSATGRVTEERLRDRTMSTSSPLLHDDNSFSAHHLVSLLASNSFRLQVAIYSNQIWENIWAVCHAGAYHIIYETVCI